MNLKITMNDGNIYSNNTKVACIMEDNLYIMEWDNHGKEYGSLAGRVEHPREIEPLIRDWMRSRKIVVLPAIMRKLRDASPLSENE